MVPFTVQGPSRVNGKVSPPGDKSIAHRFLILGCLSRNSTVINNFPFNDDCLATARAFKCFGLEIVLSRSKGSLKVKGKGLRGLERPGRVIFTGESGTTLRLLLGVLAGQDFPVKLTCARALAKRPMLRVTAPLRKMGAKIICRKDPQGEEYPPVIVRGGGLTGIIYKMPVASAQVKSAILLAGLYAMGRTQVVEPVKTRDHTERLLKSFGAAIKTSGGKISVEGGKELRSPGVVYVPGDISSAAFFMVLAVITGGSRVVLKDTGLNPSRLGIIRVLKRMGAGIKITTRRSPGAKYEPMGDIEVKSGNLKGVVVRKSEIPSLIDELPVLMVAACFARGNSRFEGAGELRVKETDRIRSMSENLRKMGADIRVTRSEDIIIIPGNGLAGAKVKSFGDHRTAMSMVVAGMAARGTTVIDDVNCISKSFPDFLKVLRSITI